MKPLIIQFKDFDGYKKVLLASGSIFKNLKDLLFNIL